MKVVFAARSRRRSSSRSACRSSSDDGFREVKVGGCDGICLSRYAWLVAWPLRGWVPTAGDFAARARERQGEQLDKKVTKAAAAALELKLGMLLSITDGKNEVEDRPAEATAAVFFFDDFFLTGQCAHKSTILLKSSSGTAR